MQRRVKLAILTLSLVFINGEGNGTPLSTLAWKIPWTEEPGRLQTMGSLRVRNDWVTSLSLFTFMHWRRKWQPTPVFLPGESQGRRNLVSCHLWGRTSWTRLKQLSNSSSSSVYQSILHGSIHFIFITALWRKYYCCLHFTDDETEVWRS